jgi:hypothetical protein
VISDKPKNRKNIRNIFYLWLITVFSTLIVWTAFSTRNQMTKVFANFDGPNYLVIAKCGYNPECIRKNFSLPLPLEYYPAHFPGYPLLISFLDQFLPGWWAMLAVTLFSTGIMVAIFYLLLKQLQIKSAFWLSFILLFLPARTLVLRSVGAPETLFIAVILGSIYFYLKEKYWLAGLFLAAAQLTKTPAILLFGAYGIDIFLQSTSEDPIREPRRFLDIKPRRLKQVLIKRIPLLIGPVVLLPLFLIFQKQTGNFWAYFHSGDNFHLIPLPFQTFISSRSWLGDFWLEDIFYVYLVGGLAITQLWKKYRVNIITIFPAVFYLATLFVAHRDISRYSAPLYPFWIIGFQKALKKKEFKIIFLILLPAAYLFAINFINYNVAPIADWSPYK